MRLSELSGKEIVNLCDGVRLGIIGDCELAIEEKSGRIMYLIVPQKSHFFILGERNYIEINWQWIKKIGPDLVIVELENKMQKKYGF